MMNNRDSSHTPDKEDKEKTDSKASVTPQKLELSKDIGAVVSPMLSFDDKISSMQVSQSFYHFFHEHFLIEKLLHHIVYGEFKSAEAMIKKDPTLLLQSGSVKIAHNGQTFQDKTPLQIALYLKDPAMVELFQTHLEDLKEIQQQQKAQFLDGYEESKLIAEGYSILEDIFRVINEADITADEKHNLTLDQNAQLAINRLEDYLKNRCTSKNKTGQDIGDALLIRTYELFDENYVAFGEDPHSPKNMLVWQQVVGKVQRFSLTFHNIQAMGGDGVRDALERMQRGEHHKRKSTFAYRHGADFLSMVSNPESGLGVDYAIYATGLWIENAAGSSGVETFKDLCQLKNEKVKQLIKHPARPTTPESKSGCFKRKPGSGCLVM